MRCGSAAAADEAAKKKRETKKQKKCLRIREKRNSMGADPEFNPGVRVFSAHPILTKRDKVGQSGTNGDPIKYVIKTMVLLLGDSKSNKDQ